MSLPYTRAALIFSSSISYLSIMNEETNALLPVYDSAIPRSTILPLLLPFNTFFAASRNPTQHVHSFSMGNLDLKQQSSARCNWNWPLAICRSQTERRINSNNNNALWTKWCLIRCAYLCLPAFLHTCANSIRCVGCECLNERNEWTTEHASRLLCVRRANERKLGERENSILTNKKCN